MEVDMEAKEQSREAVLLDGHTLTIEQVVRVARGSNGVYPMVVISSEATEKIIRMREAIESLVAEKVMYGINTGAGINRNRVVPANLLLGYQRDYILAHCVGNGPYLSKEITRAMILLRANSFAVGHSGVTIELCQRLVELLNRDVIPVVPQFGSLGASGDLAPLAHLGAVLIGHADTQVWHHDQLRPTKDVYQELGIEAYRLKAKEAMAITNGSTMTLAYACFIVHEALRLLPLANLAAAMNVEAIRGEKNAFDDRIHEARNQVGQRETANVIRNLLSGSRRITAAAQAICFIHDDSKDCVESCAQARVQDAYSIRCVPQMHGAFSDALTHLRDIVAREVNAATDNPLVFEKGEEFIVLSGGNFHGDTLAIPLDMIAIALAKLANAINARLFRLINKQFSFGLPQDLSANDNTQSTGFMIVQYACLADALRASMLAAPASVFTGITSGGQEDIVSNGANAAWKAFQIIDYVRDALAKEFLAVCQAIDLGADKLGPELSQLGAGTEKAYKRIRREVSMMRKDRYLRSDIETIKALIVRGDLHDAVFNNTNHK